jgi:hypothetical protein
MAWLHGGIRQQRAEAKIMEFLFAETIDGFAGRHLWREAMRESRCRWHRYFLLALLLLPNTGIAPLTAQEQESDAAGISREYQIKAAYIYQFGRYVQWPAGAFESPTSPFVIGVLREDPVALDMGQLIRTKKIQNRPVEIRQLSATSDFSPCHILFFSTAIQPDVQADIIRRVSKKPILLVGETDDFIKNGGVIDFVTEDDRVHLYIARKAAKRQGLLISSRLLQVARVVD